MIKRALAATLCLMLAFALLPKTARAANATSVSIWGKALEGTNLYYHNGTNGFPGTADNEKSGANATFDPSTTPPTLTLNGLDVRNSDVARSGITYAIYANGDLAINVIAYSEVSSITNANSYAVYVLGDLTFTGTGTLVATAANDDNATGVYVHGDLHVNSGTLEGRVGIEGNKTSSYGVHTAGSITVDGGTLVGKVSGTSNKTMSFGVYAATTLTVESGSLEGRSGAVTMPTGGSLRTGTSAGVSAGNVTITGGTLTGIGNTATAPSALSYGLYTKTLVMNGGTITANGGAASGSSGSAYSAGVAVNGDLSVSGGLLTAQGGSAESSGGATAQSSGVYAEAGSISFSGGTVDATGGGNTCNSYGIKNAGVFNNDGTYQSGGAITVSDTAVVTANGNNPMNNSYGLYCRGIGLTVSGGTLNATSSGTGSACRAVFAFDSVSKIMVSGGSFTAIANTDIAAACALSKALETGGNVTAKGSTASNGSNPQPYVATDNSSYKWVSAKPTVTSVQVNPATVSVQKGGTQNFNATVMGAVPAQTVTWTVEGGMADTRIEPNGALTIAADETATSLTVRATSTVNTAISGTATVTVAAQTYTIALSPATMDFGSLIAGYTVPTAQTLTITNSGNWPVDVDTSTLSGGNYDFTDFSATQIAAGSSVTCKVAPKPGLAVGTYSTPITVSTTQGSTATLTPSFTVIAATHTIAVTPEAYDFGTKSKNYWFRPAKQEFTVQNTGNSPVTLSALTGSTKFEIVTPNDWTTELAPNGTRKFDVRPFDRLDTGTYDETFTVSTTQGTSDTFGAKFVVGTEMNVTITGNPSSLAIIDGQSVALTANITGGTAGASYTYAWTIPIDSDTPFADTQTVTVSPTANTTYQVEVTEVDNSRNTATATVTVTAATHGITVSPATLTFGTVNEGYPQPAAQTVTVTYTGNIDSVTLTQPTSTDYDIGTLSRTTIDTANTSSTFTVQPKANLGTGTYTTPINIATTLTETPTLTVTPNFTVNGAFTVGITGDLNIIAGESTTLTANAAGGSGTYTYQWFKDAEMTAFSTANAVTVSPTVTTTYKVVAHDTIEGKNATATVTVAAQTYTIALSPSTMDFGSLLAGYTVPTAQTLTITNSGNWPVDVDTSALSGENYSFTDFSATQIAAGSSVTCKVAPKPGLAAGTYNAPITVSTTQGSSATLTPSFTVIAATHTIAVTPESYDFGTKSKNYWFRPAKQEFTVQNTGNSPVTLSALTGSTKFEIVTPNDWTTELAPSGKRKFTVQPKGGLDTGTYEETFTASTGQGTSDTFKAKFVVGTEMNVTITGNPSSLAIIEGQSVALTANITGGTAGASYTYAWTIPATSTTPFADTKIVTVSPTASTTYQVLVTEVDNSRNTATATVTVTAATHGITINPATLDFGTVNGAYPQPAAQTVTVTYTGNIGSVTLTQPTSTDYDIGTLSRTTLDTTNTTATFTVQPKAGLSKGVYTAPITVSTDKDSNAAAVTPSFTVVSIHDLLVSPNAAFMQGNAPETKVTVGAGITGFGLGNFVSAEMGPQGGAFTLLTEGTEFDKAEGSIIITLHKSYLDTLAPGVYTLRINLTGAGYPAYVETTIIVNAQGTGGDMGSTDVPKTGDAANPALWLGLMLLAGAGLAVSAVRRKRRNG